MEPRSNNTFEQALEQMARGFQYPPTPDIPAIRRSTVDGRQQPEISHRLVWALLLIALIATALFAIPQTRAAVLSLFARIGAIDIFIDESAPTPPPEAPTALPAAPSGGAVEHSLALFELGEPVGLDEARRLVEFALVVPAVLGEPDEVYAHRNVEPPAVTLVWRDEAGVALSLTEIGAGQFITKLVHEYGVSDLLIGDRPAMWIESPHRLQLLSGWQDSELLIESNVLIWALGGVTYRLEGNLTQDEALAIAESIESREHAPVE
jgi:hypothetical protein